MFTTRPDTLFGATYVVLAPEHALAQALASPAQAAAVKAYIQAAGRKSDLERTDLARSKSGVATGASVRNPATGEPIPVWVADYVLGGYGSGAIMAVPAHDKRDADFAQQFGLPVRRVVADPAAAAGAVGESCFAGDGMLLNSCNAAAGLDINGASPELRPSGLLRARLASRAASATAAAATNCGSCTWCAQGFPRRRLRRVWWPGCSSISLGRAR